MSLARDVTTVGCATLVSRLLGFVRDMGIAAVLGAGVFADAFFAVLQLTNVFRRLLAEGALNAAFVPLWLRIKAAAGRGRRPPFLQEVLARCCSRSPRSPSIGFLFAPAVVDVLAPGFDAERSALAADYLRIATPYVVLAGIVAVMAAALNAEGRVGAVALGIVAFNAVLLLALAWVAAFGATPPAAGATLAHAIVLAGIAQLAGDRRGLLAAHRPEHFPGGSGSRNAPPRLCDIAVAFGRDAALLRARRPSLDRRRHPAIQADRRRDGGVVVAGRGVVALLCQPALRTAARGRCRSRSPRC